MHPLEHEPVLAIDTLTAAAAPAVTDPLEYLIEPVRAIPVLLLQLLLLLQTL